MQSVELKEIIDWLIDGARSAPNPAALLKQTCERLVAAGVPVCRCGASAPSCVRCIRTFWAAISSGGREPR